MGILNGILRIKGNVGELNFVNYGQKIIVRRKRGTVKPAKVNKKFQDNVNRNPGVMKIAKPIMAIMKEYTQSKRLGRFWPNMLGRLFKCKNDKLETHLQSLKELQIDGAHALAMSPSASCNFASQMPCRNQSLRPVLCLKSQSFAPDPSRATK